MPAADQITNNGAFVSRKHNQPQVTYVDSVGTVGRVETKRIVSGMARVLVVEDDLMIANMLEMILQHEQHIVLLAGDGMRGVELATAGIS